MPDPDYDLILAASTALLLRRWPDHLLAALNLAVSWGPEHPVPAANNAFDRAVEEKLLREDGQPYDREALARAISHIVNERIETGTWGVETEP